MPRKLLGCMVALAWTLQFAIVDRSAIAVAQSEVKSIEPLKLEEALSHGRELEIQQRWQEAINHYEKLHRKYPDSEDANRRLQIVRIHYDIWRRYTDQSFINTVDRTNTQSALTLYAEILGKLELYYVDPISLPNLLRNGTVFLEVALTEPDFLTQNVSHVPTEKIEAFRTSAHRSIVNRPVGSVREAQALVLNIANQAAREIGANPTAVVYEYIAGAIGMLDPYSAFLTAGEYNEIMSQIEGNLIGIGVELWADKSDLEIVEVFNGGPASEGGLLSGDRIVQIDNYRVLDIGAKRAADLLRGPEFSKVTLQFERNDGSVQSRVIVRRRIEVPSVTDVKIADATQGIGYFRITNFQKTTASEVDTALIDLTNQGMRMLVIDLRRNPGGLLDAAVDISDRFLEHGGIVSTRGRNGAENHNFAAHYAGTTRLPLMVMIDEDSASASEIFAGAIRDNNRGMIVGRTSYGKGSVQGVFHNDVGQGGVRLTVSKFFSPTGYAISSRGIIPHVEFPAIEESQEVLVAKPVLNGDASERSADRRDTRRVRQELDDADLQRAIVEARSMLTRVSSR